MQDVPEKPTKPAEAPASRRLAELLKQISQDNDKRDREAAQKRRQPPKDTPPIR